MKRVNIARAFLFFLIGAGSLPVGGKLLAAGSDPIGIALLQSLVTNLDGSGSVMLQPEAGDTTATNWQVNPNVIGQSASQFTYSASGGSTNIFPNPLGGVSGHADSVTGNFHSVAPNAGRVDNCEANYFYNSVVATLATNFGDPLANQSYTFGNVPAGSQQAIDFSYDNYSSQFNTLFISAANNGGPVSPPATSYNGIAVGAYGGSSSVGPTIDNGRSKPDITAPADATSFSTPLVTGAAALLRQAGLRGDGGSDTNSATDMRVLKALLLNGAIKPVDWTNHFPSPLDTRYGAGVLNIFNSYQQLASGKQGFIASTFCATNSPHPPTGDLGTVGVLSGWDFNTNASTATSNGVNHYFFNVTNGRDASTFTATATLVWNRHLRKLAINNLALFLYDANSGALVACSTSLVDNVQHIYLPRLPQGRYDLQIVKNGGATVSATEPYALAFEFFSTPLTIAQSGGSTILTWPVYPDGFTLQTATNFSAPLNWTTLTNTTPTVTNNQNCVVLPTTGGFQMFRLSR